MYNSFADDAPRKYDDTSTFLPEPEVKGHLASLLNDALIRIKMLEQQLEQYKQLCHLYQQQAGEYQQQPPDGATVAKVDEQIRLLEQTLKNTRNRAN